MAIFQMDNQAVIAAMKAKSLGGQKQTTVNVGYSAPYAVYVHEDLTCAHPNGGQAKYLSTPSRSPAVRQAMRAALKAKLLAKKGLVKALTEAANVLLQASLPLVPVDTGFLKDSHFVSIK